MGFEMLFMMLFRVSMGSSAVDRGEVFDSEAKAFAVEQDAQRAREIDQVRLGS